MSIPARRDHDPDLVITAGLCAAEERIAQLEAAQIDHENDCACLPEDRSVTETVEWQRRRIAELEAKITE